MFVLFVGVAIGALGFLATIVRQARLVCDLPEVDDERWNMAVALGSRKMGLAHCPRTIVSNHKCVPSTIGILQPTLVVPCDWRDWNDEQRDCILLHELAHVRRRDVASQCLARVAKIVHWFNPLVWYAAKKLRAERELASDDCVLQTGRSPSNYAEQLLATLKRYRPSPMALGVAMASSARLRSSLGVVKHLPRWCSPLLR